MNRRARLPQTYSQVAEAVEDVALGFEGWRGVSKIDFSESDKAAQREASDLVSEAVARSKMEMLSAFGESGEALKAFEELLKKQSGAKASAG